jgi:hypothetical protein|tara:strand:- start:254 stop:598 length:345 start_codon:yes stop_codon:yes gene_type:complete
MVKQELMMIKFIIFLYLLSFSTNLLAGNDTDQWKDSKKNYKDLIEEGFEVKAYDTNTINVDGGLILLLFITVLQKGNVVYECQEYQTLDSSMKTLDMSLVCKELVYPYQRGIGT